jgi:hypothetical protein
MGTARADGSERELPRQTLIEDVANGPTSFSPTSNTLPSACIGPDRTGYCHGMAELWYFWPPGLVKPNRRPRPGFPIIADIRPSVLVLAELTPTVAAVPESQDYCRAAYCRVLLRSMCRASASLRFKQKNNQIKFKGWQPRRAARSKRLKHTIGWMEPKQEKMRTAPRT